MTDCAAMAERRIDLLARRVNPSLNLFLARDPGPGIRAHDRTGHFCRARISEQGAGAPRVGRHRADLRRAARRSLTVDLAGARRALAVRAAGPRVIDAGHRRIGAARRHVRARAHRARQRARLARARAGGRAADALRAVVRQALTARGTEGAVRFLAARVPDAHVAGSSSSRRPCSCRSTCSRCRRMERMRLRRAPRSSRSRCRWIPACTCCSRSARPRRRCPSCNGGSRPRRRTCRPCRRWTAPASDTCCACRRRPPRWACRCRAPTAARTTDRRRCTPGRSRRRRRSGCSRSRPPPNRAGRSSSCRSCRTDTHGPRRSRCRSCSG